MKKISFIVDYFKKYFLGFTIILLISFLTSCSNEKQFSCDDNILSEGKWDFSINVDVQYYNGTVNGTVQIINNGEDINDVNGKYPLRLGISVCNEDGEILLLDYAHLAFENDTLVHGEINTISLCFDELKDVYEKGYGLSFDVLQEGVAWNSRKEIVMLKDIVNTELTWEDRLYTPTQIVKIDDKYFIEDCWHHRIIYSTDLNLPINKWNILTDDIMGGHSIADCNDFIIIDDTDEDKLLVFKKSMEYELVQEIYIDWYIPKSITYGEPTKELSRPHYVLYDSENNKVYVSLSWAGSVISFYEKNGKFFYDQFYYIADSYLKFLNYFDGYFYLVAEGSVLEGNFTETSFEINNKYSLPDELENLGINFIAKIKDMYYISTWSNGGLYSFETFDDLQDGYYNNIGSDLGIKGIPYYITCFDNEYYITDIVNNSGIIKLNC